jgi:predicted deacylase
MKRSLFCLLTPANSALVRLGALMCLATFATAASSEDWGALQILGRDVMAGTSARFPFVPDRTFESSYLNMPVFVARGAAAGPTLCLTAGVHGDELNGVEIARRAFSTIDARALRGTVIALPAINAEGVRTGNRYLSDRRDLNRAFPGSAGGSVARLIAYKVSTEVLVHCDALIDLHTASNERTNLPQIRADRFVPTFPTPQSGNSPSISAQASLSRARGPKAACGVKRRKPASRPSSTRPARRTASRTRRSSAASPVSRA